MTQTHWPARCMCCLTIKYPGGEKSLENHKCSFCASGARSTMAASEQNKPPVQPGMNILNSGSTALPYPLPPGIFENGTPFNPLAFTKKVTQLYEQIIINKESGDLVMQDEAFATLLMRCTVTLEDGTVVFKMVECETLKSTASTTFIWTASKTPWPPDLNANGQQFRLELSEFRVLIYPFDLMLEPVWILVCRWCFTGKHD